MRAVSRSPRRKVLVPTPQPGTFSHWSTRNMPFHLSALTPRRRCVSQRNLAVLSSTLLAVRISWKPHTLPFIYVSQRIPNLRISTSKVDHAINNPRDSWYRLGVFEPGEDVPLGVD